LLGVAPAPALLTADEHVCGSRDGLAADGEGAESGADAPAGCGVSPENLAPSSPERSSAATLVVAEASARKLGRLSLAEAL